MRNWVGQQFGNYRLLRRLGKGSSGQVYLGEHIYLKTNAAIKLLLGDGDGGQGEAFHSAFLQEARNIATLKHPHILRILEFGMEASTPYLVMDYAAHGSLLGRHPRGSRVGIEQVLSYARQIAEALEHAHKARLIHRDVKPANVLLDEADTILLSDFGIATIAHHTTSIRTIAYAGTPAYTAPEQLQGKPVPASDQYALAIMLYEWLCGHLPYQGDPIAVGMQHLTAPIPELRTHNQAVPSGMEAAIQQAMAKDPKKRFVSMLEFANALEQTKETEQFSFPSPSTPIKAIELIAADGSQANSLSPAIPTTWGQVQHQEERNLFLLATFFPETEAIPLWLLGLAAGLGEEEEAVGKASQHLQELDLFEKASEGLVQLHAQKRDFGQHHLHTMGNEGRILVAVAGERLLNACSTIEKTEQRARRVGYRESILQIQNIREYLNWLGGNQQGKQLEDLERWLSQESYLLADSAWWPDTLPGLFSQQLYNRSVEAGSPLTIAQEPQSWLRLNRPVGAEDLSFLRIFADTHEVTSAAFSPDGCFVLTGSEDGARLWEIKSGRELLRMGENLKFVNCVAISPDGKMALTGSNDNSACLWEIESGREIRQLQGHTKSVESVAFSPDGQLALTGSWDTTARLWDVSNGREMRQLLGHTKWIWSVAFSLDGKVALTGSDDETARLWEVSSGRELRQIETGRAVRSIAFSPDGQMILTGSNTKTARIWEASSGRELWRLHGHTADIKSAAFSPDGKLALTGSNDKTVCVWDVRNGRELQRLNHTQEVNSVAFSSDGQWVVSCTHDKTARVWELSNRKECTQEKELQSEVQCVVFSPDGRLVLTGSDEKASLWEVHGGQKLQRLIAVGSQVRNIAFFPDGQRILTSTYDSVKIWETSSGRKVQEWGVKGSQCMALSPDGQIVLTGKYREARLWEVKSGQTVSHLQGLTDTVNCVAFSPDGSLAFTGADDARLWEVSSGRELLRLEGYKNSIESVAISPDGRLVVTGSYDGVRMWEIRSGRELLHLKDHTDDTLRVAFSPDGSFILAGDIYGRVYFYRAQGPERGRLLGMYVAPYEVGAMYWQSAHQVTLADMGGPTWRPHFSDVTLEGVWEFE